MVGRMKQYFKLLAIIFLISAISCNKGFLKHSFTFKPQTPTKFPKWWATFYDAETAGSFQLRSQTSAFYVSKNLPSREILTGRVTTNMKSPIGIDVGTFCIENHCAKIVPHSPNNDKYGVDYQNGDNVDSIFGKVVHYKLQKGNDKPIFSGSFYVPEKIKFERPNPGGIAYWSRTTGTIHWTPDPNNKTGVGVFLTFYNNVTQKSRGGVFVTDDDGELLATDFVTASDSIYTQVSVELYRGNSVVKQGTDGRKYKLVVYSTCFNDFFFQP
jgi:hypothetical protein